MEYNQDNGFNNNESIFTSLNNQPNLSGFQDNLQNVQIRSNSVIGNFIDSISNKIEEFKALKLQKEAQKVFEETGPFLRLLNEYGCVVELKPDCINVDCVPLKRKGVISIKEDKSLEYDDDMKYIFSHIANLINRSDSLSDIITKYEEQGFYPIGELTKEKAIINGKECEVLVGTLENLQKEQKTIYYYEGQELFLGE